MERRQHWNGVYSTKGEQEVSWFESLPLVSLQMLEAAGMTSDTCVLDVGGGDSRLVDHLAARGLDCLAVLDVSGAALSRARQRLGTAASIPIWIEADVSGDWSLKPMDIWHDRAVFHFLTTPADRDRYRIHLRQTLKPGGSAIIATFALDGPEKCSGLPIQRYSAVTLTEELGDGLELVEAIPHVHTLAVGQQTIVSILPVHTVTLNASAIAVLGYRMDYAGDLERQKLFTEKHAVQVAANQFVLDVLKRPVLLSISGIRVRSPGHALLAAKTRWKASGNSS